MAPGVFLSRAETQNTTLAQLLDWYRREITPQKRGARMEQSHLKIISEDPVARCVVAPIAGKELAACRNRRLKTVSPSILNREINILSHVFTVAAQGWHIHLPWGNPVRLVRRPRVQNKRDRRLVGDEQAGLLVAARITSILPCSLTYSPWPASSGVEYGGAE